MTITTELASDKAVRFDARIVHARVRSLLQLALASEIALIGPFVLYAVCGHETLDISEVMYALTLATYGLTVLLIGAQSVAAKRTQTLSLMDSLDIKGSFDWSKLMSREIELLRRPPPGLSRIERWTVTVWRPAYVWLCPQCIPLAAYWLWKYGFHGSSARMISIGALVAAWLLHGELARRLIAIVPFGREDTSRKYSLSTRRLSSVGPYGVLRNTVARIAQVRLLLGDAHLATPHDGTREDGSSALTSTDTGSHSVGSEGAESPGADAVSSAQLSRGVSGDATTETSPLSGGAQEFLTPLDLPPERETALRAAADLEEAFVKLVALREDQRAELHLLQRRLESWEKILDARRTLTLQLTAQSESAMSPADTRELEGALTTLIENPGDVSALMVVSRKADGLAEAVRLYALVHQALGDVSQP